MRQQIRDEVASLTALDARERSHIDQALAWIDSGAELCRLHKPATPPMHLVSYFVVVDGSHVLLVDHKNAQRWLPPGGHADPGEHPRTTVAREMAEELGVHPRDPVGAPLMITCTETVGLTAGHVDVSLWYVVEARRSDVFQFDPGEFHAIAWFAFDAVPWERAEPDLPRFIRKLAARSAS